MRLVAGAGRDTLNTDRDNTSSMMWIRADRNNAAHRFNIRVGIERQEIVAYCADLLDRVEEPLSAQLLGSADAAQASQLPTAVLCSPTL